MKEDCDKRRCALSNSILYTGITEILKDLQRREVCGEGDYQGVKKD